MSLQQMRSMGKGNAMQTEFHPPASQLPSLSICLPFPYPSSYPSQQVVGRDGQLLSQGRRGGLATLTPNMLHVDLAKAFASKIKPSAIWVYDNGVLLKEKPFFLPLPLLWQLLVTPKPVSVQLQPEARRSINTGNIIGGRFTFFCFIRQRYLLACLFLSPPPNSAQLRNLWGIEQASGLAGARKKHYIIIMEAKYFNSAGVHPSFTSTKLAAPDGDHELRQKPVAPHTLPDLSRPSLSGWSTTCPVTGPTTGGFQEGRTGWVVEGK